MCRWNMWPRYSPETIQALVTQAGCRNLTRKQKNQSFGLTMNRVPGAGCGCRWWGWGMWKLMLQTFQSVRIEERWQKRRNKEPVKSAAVSQLTDEGSNPAPCPLLMDTDTYPLTVLLKGSFNTQVSARKMQCWANQFSKIGEICWSSQFIKQQKCLSICNINNRWGYRLKHFILDY